jgi:hypothetical protein
MPYPFLYRTILEECRTVDEAVELLRSAGRQSANNLMLMDAGGARALVEIAPDGIVVRRASDDAPRGGVATLPRRDTRGLYFKRRHSRCPPAKTPMPQARHAPFRFAAARVAATGRLPLSACIVIAAVAGLAGEP